MGELRLHARVPLTALDSSNRLLADYQAGEPGLAACFARQPADIPALARATHAPPHRARLAEALVAYQQHLGADEAAQANARLLADPTTPVITVGQQPGLLTGPLYTPYKALTAIALARQVAMEIGRPVVPVFWIGADDDDVAEVDHCGWWDAHDGVQHIRYPADAQPGRLVGDLPLGVHGDAVLQQVAPLLAGMPYGEEVRALLAETLRESVDFGEWFARLMARLFSRFGLVMCDPRLPVARACARDIFAQEIATPLTTTNLLNAQARALHEQGYHPALTKPDEVCNFFLHEGTRARVTYVNGHFRTQARDYTGDELRAMLAAHPERFIPNAVLRPVVQEHLFSSAAFVAGPNELGYWAELRPVFAALHVPMPPVVPRAGATLMPRNSARRLREWDVSPLDLLQQYDTVRYRLLADAAPPTFGKTFAGARATLEGLVADVTGELSMIDTTLAQSALSSHQRMVNEIERLEHKALKAVERRQTTLTDRLESVRGILFPAHGLQERAFNLCSVLARYGLDVPKKLLHVLLQEEGQHCFVEIGDKEHGGAMP